MVQERSLHNGCMALPVCHPARRVRGHRPALLEEKSLFGLSKVARPGTSMRFGPKKVEFIRLVLISQKHTSDKS